MIFGCVDDASDANRNKRGFSFQMDFISNGCFFFGTENTLKQYKIDIKNILFKRQKNISVSIYNFHFKKKVRLNFNPH